MNSRINQAMRSIAALRAEMAVLEAAIRDQVKRDVDCRDDALRLLALRKEVSRLIADWKLAGGDGQGTIPPQRLSAGRGSRPASAATRNRAAELRR